MLLGILLFVGFEAAASIGEESHDPHRSIPRAVISTVAAAGAFFVLMAYAFSIGYGKEAVSQGAWAFSPAPVSEMATEYVGSWFATLLELVVILDATALALAICVVIGRGFFALGRDGLVPSVFAKTSRFNTPWVGNLMVAVGGIGRRRWRSDPGWSVRTWAEILNPMGRTVDTDHDVTPIERSSGPRAPKLSGILSRHDQSGRRPSSVSR